MTAARFFYLIPAESRYRLSTETRWQHLRRIGFQRRKRLPTGGVKVIYQHCDLLDQNGVAARPVHLGDFTVEWMEHRCRPITAREARRIATPDDILVVPERIPRAVAPFPCRTKIAFVQNGGLVEGAVAGKRYEDFGFTGILCCGPYLGDFMASRSTLPRYVVTNGIRLDLFRPAPERRRANAVLFLRRKQSWRMGSAAIALLPAELRRAIEVVELENRFSEREMAAFYQQADVFVALGFPEGFALPPLEAMACGCAVVGFTGGGGAQHMRDGETALVVPDGDVEGLSRALQRVLTDESLRERLRRGGLAKSQEFTMAAMERELMAFVSALRGTPARC
jgi:glycosyltransferase involved in cell wall biosynthesis